MHLSFCQGYKRAFDSLICVQHRLNMETSVSNCYMVGAFTVFHCLRRRWWGLGRTSRIKQKDISFREYIWKNGSLLKPGQMDSLGLPIVFIIWSNNSVSPRAGNKAWCCSNSALFSLKMIVEIVRSCDDRMWRSYDRFKLIPKTHPADHMSIADECVLDPNKISGARYQRVTTFGVDGCFGLPKVRDKPKSASFSIPPSKLKIQLWNSPNSTFGALEF